MARTKYVAGVAVQMTTQEEADFDAQAAADVATTAALVPPVITNDQFRQALRNTSQATINAFKTYVAGASEDIQDYWQYRPFIRRNHPNVEAARVALGRTQAQIDTFFRNAAQIV